MVALRSIENEEESAKLIAAIARTLYDAVHRA